MYAVLDYLYTIQPLSIPEREHVQQILHFDEWPPKRMLLKVGQTCDRIRFAEYGLLRCFHIDRGREVTTGFMQENDFVVSVASFFQQIPSVENIEVLERAGLWSITYRELQECYAKFPGLNALGRIVLEKYYLALEQRLHALQGKTARARFKYLTAHCPELLGRAPVKDLASYLGMAGENPKQAKICLIVASLS